MARAVEEAAIAAGLDPPALALTEQDTLRVRLREITERQRTDPLRCAAAQTRGNKPVADRYGGVPRDLPTLPGVNALSIATRYIDGGRARFIEFVQYAVLNELPAAQAFYFVYCDLLPAERARVSFDDVCAAAGVRPDVLMAEIVSTAMQFGQDVGNLVAAATKPTIMHQLTKSAKRIGGKHAEIAMKDRHEFLRAQGMLVVPKSAQVHVHASASANAQAAAAAAIDPSMPSFAASMEALAAPRTGVQQELQRQALAAPDPDLAPIDAEVVEGAGDAGAEGAAGAVPLAVGARP